MFLHGAMHFPLWPCTQYTANTLYRKFETNTVFSEMKLRGLVSVSELYIPMIGPLILLYCVCRPIVEIYKCVSL